MLNSKVIVVTVAVLGLGGIGVAAASGAVKIPNAAGVQGTQSTNHQSTTAKSGVRNSYQVVPSVVITGAQETDLHLNVNETATVENNNGNVNDVEVDSEFTNTITSTETMTDSNYPAEEIGLKFGEDITDVEQLHNSGDKQGEIMSGHDMTEESVKNAGNDNEDQGNQGAKSSEHDKTHPQPAQNNGKHGEGNQGKGKKP